MIAIVTSGAHARILNTFRNTAAEIAVALLYLLLAVAHLTTVPRVNVDEPWMMQIADELRKTGIPSLPMFGMSQRLALEPGYALVMSVWMAVVGGSIYDARLLSVLFGFMTVAFVYGVARALAGRSAGLFAAVFLALDSNFLGTSRTTRHDIMSAALVAASLWLFVRAARRDRRWVSAASGMAAGVALLFHVHAVWVLPALAFWAIVQYRGRALVHAGAAFVGGFVVGLLPLLLHVRTYVTQLGWFAGLNTPDLSPRGIVAAVAHEPARYTTWYFGLITLPEFNPWLRVFQTAVVIAIVFVVARILRPASAGARSSALMIGIAALCATATFAILVTSKAPAYFVQLLIPLALLGGYGASEALTLVGASRGMIVAIVLCYGASGAWHYQNWFSRLDTLQFEPYEATSRTVAALVPPGPKNVIAYPTFWLPFRDSQESRFYSTTAVRPPGFTYDVGNGYGRGYGWRVAMSQLDNAPLFVLVDDAHWGPFLSSGSDASVKWSRFLQTNCRLSAAAYGTAYGSFRSYACGVEQQPLDGPRWIVGGGLRWLPGAIVWQATGTNGSSWSKYKTPAVLEATSGRLHVSAPQGGGACAEVAVARGEAYLLSYSATNAQAADLLSVAHAVRLQTKDERLPNDASLWASLLSPSGTGETPFIATAATIRACFYSETATDLTIDNLRLETLSAAASQSISPFARQPAATFR